MDKTAAEGTNFEFADLGGVKMQGANFTGASFVGASLQGAEAIDCNFDGADFYWAEMDNFVMRNCSTKGARFPEKVVIAYGPKGVKPPEVKAVPLYRKAATPEERQKLLEAALEIENMIRNKR